MKNFDKLTILATVLLTVGAVGLVVGLVLLDAWIFMLLWNFLATGTFSFLPVIRFVDALAIIILPMTLFGVARMQVLERASRK